MNDNIAIAIIHHRSPKSADELLSLRHAEKYFKDYDVYSVSPSGVNIGKYPKINFDDKYFTDLPNNNYLRLTPAFYERFSRYTFLLVYELDSLVFSKSIGEFCNGEFDYIGAPWVRYEDGIPVELSAVGNSGFSLRRIESCMNVLTSPVRDKSPLDYWRQIGCQKKTWRKSLGALGAASKVLKYRNDIDWFVKQFVYSPRRNWSPNEDKFWSFYAQRFYPDFRIASVEQALRFSFEHAPEYCFRENGHNLPLGCHAWRKHGAMFWSPYLLV